MFLRLVLKEQIKKKKETGGEDKRVDGAHGDLPFSYFCDHLNGLVFVRRYARSVLAQIFDRGGALPTAASPNVSSYYRLINSTKPSLSCGDFPLSPAADARGAALTMQLKMVVGRGVGDYGSRGISAANTVWGR